MAKLRGTGQQKRQGELGKSPRQHPQEQPRCLFKLMQGLTASVCSGWYDAVRASGAVATQAFKAILIMECGLEGCKEKATLAAESESWIVKHEEAQ